MKIGVNNKYDDVPIEINPEASNNAKSQVNELIKNYKPGNAKSTNVKMQIVLKDETSIYSRPLRLAYSERCINVDQWLKVGIVKQSESEYTSPVILVKKRDGTPRLCVDYRKINKVIERDHFPLPLIEDQLDRLVDIARSI